MIINLPSGPVIVCTFGEFLRQLDIKIAPNNSVTWMGGGFSITRRSADLLAYNADALLADFKNDLAVLKFDCGQSESMHEASGKCMMEFGMPTHLVYLSSGSYMLLEKQDFVTYMNFDKDARLFIKIIHLRPNRNFLVQYNTDVVE